MGETQAAPPSPNEAATRIPYQAPPPPTPQSEQPASASSQAEAITSSAKETEEKLPTLSSFLDVEKTAALPHTPRPGPAIPMRGDGHLDLRPSSPHGTPTSPIHLALTQGRPGRRDPLPAVDFPVRNHRHRTLHAPGGVQAPRRVRPASYHCDAPSGPRGVEWGCFDGRADDGESGCGRRGWEVLAHVSAEVLWV